MNATLNIENITIKSESIAAPRQQQTQTKGSPLINKLETVELIQDTLTKHPALNTIILPSVLSSDLFGVSDISDIENSDHSEITITTEMYHRRSNSENVVITSGPIKKKRGRPPGSKNRTQVESINQEAGSAFKMEESASTNGLDTPILQTPSKISSIEPFRNNVDIGSSL